MNMHLKNYKTERFNGSKPSGIRTLANESGAALITALLLMAVIIALVPAAIQLTSGEFSRSSDYNAEKDAFFYAEAGLEHAKALTEASSMKQVLAGNDNKVSGITGDTDDDIDNGSFAALGAPVDGPDGGKYNKMTYLGKDYYIRAKDNDDGNANFDVDNMIVLQSIGVVGDTTATVEALVYNPPGTPVGAVTVNGDLLVSSNAQITGQCGSVHTNGDLTINGPVDNGTSANPTIEADFTASGNATTDGGTPATSESGQPNIPVPDLDITKFKQYADYTLDDFGKVFDNKGLEITGPFNSTPFKGWLWNGTNWEHKDDITDGGMFYFETDVVVGDSANPWAVSIVSTGSIQMGGTPVITNSKNPNHPPDIQNLFMVAGTDIEWNGNATQTVDGIVYAKEQIKINGNPTLNGSVISLDNFPNGAPLFDQVPHNNVMENVFSGEVTINYGCGMALPTSSPDIDVVSWKKL